MDNTIYSLQNLKEFARRLDRGNNHTPCHSENVANLAHDLCRALGIRGKKKDMIITACLIHDVGKIAVDSDILEKHEKFNNAEVLKIKLHPVISAKLAKQVGLHKTVVEAIYYHHVWFNGRGYPDEACKKGKRIPIGARILAVCDSYDSMVSQRSYREKTTREEAIEELRRSAVKQLDPRIVEVFIRVIGQAG